MPARKITQPPTWVGGTPLSSQWLQNVQDSVNGALPTGVTTFGLHEDFTFKRVSADTTGGVIHGKFLSGVLTGTCSLNTDVYTPDANTQGFLSFARGTGTGKFSIGLISNQLNVGLNDFFFSCRFKIKARANLDTIANSISFIGLGLGSGPTIEFASDLSTYWLLNPIAGAAFDSKVAVTDNAYAVFEAARVGAGNVNSFAWSVNSNLVYTGTDNTNLSNVTPQIQMYSASITSATEVIAIDYFNLLIARPVSG